MTRSEISFTSLRVLLSGLIAAHGWSRLLSGAVEPFGVWFEGQGIPFGFVSSWAITVIEIVGTPILALGRLVLPLTLLYSTIYLLGIILVHIHAGWFVVGLGRNGMEYSVLLIACLLCVGLQHLPEKRVNTK